jgi:hypothetical protein
MVAVMSTVSSLSESRRAGGGGDEGGGVGGAGGAGGAGGDKGGEGGEGGEGDSTSKPARIEMWLFHDCGTIRTYCARTGKKKKALTRELRSLLPWKVGLSPLSTVVNVLPSKLTST